MDRSRIVPFATPLARPLSRRAALRGLGGAGLAALSTVALLRLGEAAQNATPSVPATKQTYIYKVVAEDLIRADVYPAAGPAPHPVLVWLHPGGGIWGNRGMLHPRQQALYHGAGYTVVAADYRLAPETKLPAIAEDLHDALRWVRDEGPALFGADPARLVVVGHSFGGYLALLAGYAVVPRPRAVVAFYAPNSFTDTWATTPSSLQLPRVAAADAAAAVRHGILSEAPPAGTNPESTPRGRFNIFAFQQGIWVPELTGYDPRVEAAALTPYEPIRHVGADFPPTLLLHGDQDRTVAYAESVALAGALAKAGVMHQLITIPGAGHLFDQQMDKPTVAAAFRQVLAFLGHQLVGASPPGGTPRATPPST